MCGIFGVIQNEKQRIGNLCKFMEDMTKLGTLRGKDSTGFFQVRDLDDVAVFKQPYAGELVAEHIRAKSIFNMADTHPITIGHHRAATRGEVSLANCHPFEHWNDKKYLVGVHNGYFAKYYTKEDGIDFEVDSDWGLYRIFRDGAAKTLAEAIGAYAIVWYENDGKVRIATNHQRDLHFAFIADRNAMVVASEHGMLHCAASRNALKLENTILFPNSETIYTFDPKDVRAFTKEKYELPKSHAGSGTSVRGRDNWGRGWHGLQEDQFDGPNYGGTTGQEGVRQGSLLGLTKDYIIEGEKVVFGSHAINTRLKLNLGETIEFFPDWNDVAALKKTDTHLPGWVTTSDEIALKAVMVDVTPQIRTNVLGATKETSMVECRVIGVVQFKVDGKMIDACVVSKPNRIVHVSQDDAGSASAEVTLDNEATIPGPDGVMITPKDFERITHEGCGYCSGSFIPRDAEENKIVWRAADTGIITPLHKDCAIALSKAV